MNWELWQSKFQQLQLRERRLVFFASLGLFGWLCVVLVLEPAWIKHQQQRQQLASVSAQLQQTEQGIVQLQDELSRNINQEVQQRLTRLEGRALELEQQLAARTAHFVGADRVLPMLQSLLMGDARVRLLSLQSMPPSVVAYDADQQPLLYQHKIRLVMQGDYSALRQLLTTLEQLPWQLGWHSLQYRVTEHPLAELALDIVTVGDHADFIQL